MLVVLSGVSFLVLLVVSWAEGGLSSSKGVSMLSCLLRVVQGLTPFLGSACCNSSESQ